MSEFSVKNMPMFDYLRVEMYPNIDCEVAGAEWRELMKKMNEFHKKYPAPGQLLCHSLPCWKIQRCEECFATHGKCPL